MKNETIRKIYEIAFGCNARPEELNDLPKDVRRPSFTEDDLIERLEEYSRNSYIIEEMKPSDRALIFGDEEDDD